MRILLVSDTHKDTGRMAQILNTCGHVDMIVHCGDMDVDCDYIASLRPQTPLLAVQGNNEFFCQRPYHIVDEVEGQKIYITHGHKERVKAGYDGLIAAAKKKGCALAFFGHTHQQEDITKDGIRLINPGSATGMYGSFAILNITSNAITVNFHVL